MCFFRFQYFSPFRSSLLSSLFLCKEVSSFWLRLSLAPCSPISFLFNTLLRLPFSSLCYRSLLRYCSSSLSHLCSLPHLPAFSNAQGFSPLFSAFHPFHSSPLLVLSSPQPLLSLFLPSSCLFSIAHTFLPISLLFFPPQVDDQSLSTPFLTPWGLLGNLSLFPEDPKKGISGELVGYSLHCLRPWERIKTCDLLRKFLL